MVTYDLMLPIRLDAGDDPRVAEYRMVADPELVGRRGLFVAEGRLVVQRLIEDGRFSVRSVLVSETAFAALSPLFGRLPPDVPVYVSSPPALSGLIGFKVHRGCLALAERPQPLSCPSLLEPARVVVIVEGVADPSNLGGIFRNTLALGGEAVLLSPSCCDPLYRKAVRTSMAATLRVPFGRFARWPEGLEEVRAAGFTLAALTPQPPAASLEAFVSGGLPARLAVLLGTEGAGVTPEAAAFADVRLRIPVNPDADSVNVAVAAGIALYRLAARFT